MATSLIQLRVDEKLKKQADELFADLGLDTTTALRIFLKQALKVGGLPFKVLKEKRNGYSLDESPTIKRLDREFEKLPKVQQEAIIKEVRAEMFCE